MFRSFEMFNTIFYSIFRFAPDFKPENVSLMKQDQILQNVQHVLFNLHAQPEISDELMKHVQSHQNIQHVLSDLYAEPDISNDKFSFYSLNMFRSFEMSTCSFLICMPNPRFQTRNLQPDETGSDPSKCSNVQHFFCKLYA